MSRTRPSIRDLDALAELARWRPYLYVRGAYDPAAERSGRLSIDDESGVRMPGLPVLTVVPEPWWPGPAVDWIARCVCKVAGFAASDGNPWLLTGSVVGYGPAQEPLIVGVEPVARLDRAVVDEALERRGVGSGAG